MSSARAARWAAQRASWKLANRGDTHVATDRRLYKKQLTELRKEWKLEDLSARRTAYEKERELTAQRKEAQEARPSRSAVDTSDPQFTAAAAEEAQWLNERKRKQQENKKRIAARRAAKLEEAETEYRHGWLQEMLKEYDVDGTTPVNAFTQYRKRAVLTPDNFDKRLHMLLVRNQSPVDNWNGVARRLEADEQRAALDERTGGRLLHSPAEPPVSPPNAATPVPAAGAAAEEGTRGLGAAGPGRSGDELDADRGGSDVGTPSVHEGGNAGSGDGHNDAALLEDLKSAMAELQVDKDDEAPKK